MNVLIILVVAAMLGAIIFLSRGASGQQGKREEYLQGMARIFETNVEKVEGAENSFFLKFIYKGVEFWFEDMEDKDREDRRLYRGFLKARLPINLTLSFSEKMRTTIRGKVDSLIETASSRAGGGQYIILPKALKKFGVFTNREKQAADLLADERVVKELARYQSVDSRGHPMMSWDIREGVVSLRFHFGTGLKPNLQEFHGNAGALEGYVQRMLVIVNKIKQLAEDV